jgi:diguanylate cyclase (GGDEF)-like protein
MAMIDLDRFKLVNDTLGHLAGDDLIRRSAPSCRQCPEGGMVARLGGDEFGLLFDSPGEDEAPAWRASACSRPAPPASRCSAIRSRAAPRPASSLSRRARSDPVDVMRRADLALNDAKHNGRGIVRVFDESMDESIRFRRRSRAG